MPMDGKRYGRSIKYFDSNTSPLLNDTCKIKRGRRRKWRRGWGRKMRRRRKKGRRKQRRRKRSLSFSERQPNS